MAKMSLKSPKMPIFNRPQKGNVGINGGVEQHQFGLVKSLVGPHRPCHSDNDAIHTVNIWISFRAAFSLP